jgi:hypothetical protein
LRFLVQPLLQPPSTHQSRHPPYQAHRSTSPHEIRTAVGSVTKLGKRLRNPHFRAPSSMDLTPRYTSYNNESAKPSINPSILTRGLTFTPIIRIMRANPATPTGDIIPNSVTRDCFAVCLAADAEALARVNLAHDAIPCACAGAAVYVIIDRRV